MRLVATVVLLGWLAGGFLCWCEPGPVLAAGERSGGVPGKAAEEPDPAGDACLMIYAALVPTPGTIVETFEGVLGDETGAASESGCTVIVSGTWAELGDAPSPDGVVFDLLAGQGWSEVPEYGADGPDGTAFGFSGNGVLCVIRGRWDGGDDADSTYVPSDAYQLIVRLRPTD